MNTPLEDFLQRSAASSSHHPNHRLDLDDAIDLDAWGNEWEAGCDDENER